MNGFNKPRGRGTPPRPGDRKPQATEIRPRPLMPRDAWETFGKAKINHPYLLWNRFPPAFREDGKRLGREGTQEQKKEEQGAWGRALEGMLKEINTNISPEILQELERRTLAGAEALRCGFGMKVLVAEAVQIEPLVSGQGEHHALEAGFCFHPVLGVPFLKGSGIKGALRHRVLMRLAERYGLQDLEDRTLAEAPVPLRRDLRLLFGTALKDPLKEGESRKKDGVKGESSGAVWCMDAFPLTGKEMVDLDVLTPHHNDFDDPKPVVYLVVSSGVRWRFVVGIGKEAEGQAGELQEAFRETLLIQGVGGKTSSAHGRFGEVKDRWLGEAGTPPAPGKAPVPVEEVLPQEVQWFMEDAGRLRNLGEAKNLLGQVFQKQAKHLPLVANRAVKNLGQSDPGAASKLAAYCHEKFGLEISWKD